MAQWAAGWNYPTAPMNKKGMTMPQAIVFHLHDERDGRPVAEDILRYDFDSRCVVDPGDVWTRISYSGRVSHHRATNIRWFEGVYGEEVHVFMREVVSLGAPGI